MIAPYYKLGDLCHIASGGTPSRTRPNYFGGSVNWVKITDMLQGEVTLTEETLSGAGLANCSAKLLPVGTVLISIFATIGRTAVLGIEAATNQAIAGVTAKTPSTLDARYLRYFLDAQRAYLRSVARGVAQPNINQSILKNLDVPQPPLSEQLNIVDILSRAESIVRLRHEAQKKAAELIPALFTDLFGDHATNPKGWPVQPLRELVKFVGGATPSKSREDFWEGDLPWVSPKDMKRLEISDAADHLDAKVLAETNLKLIPANSILVVVRGMILAHSLPLAITRSPVTINQDMKAFTPLGRVEPDYLFWALMASKATLQNKIDAAAHGTKKLDTEHLVNLNIPIPPRSLQVAWADKARAVASIQTQQATGTAQAEATFNALLAEVFAAA